MSLDPFAVASTCIAEMILELLHERVDFSPCRPSAALGGESIYHRAENNTGKKSKHQAIGEHLIRHSLTSLPEQLRASANHEGSPVYPKTLSSVKQGRFQQGRA